MVGTRKLGSSEPPKPPGARGTSDADFERALLERIGEFEIQERLGAGAMGVVWRAMDTRLGRPVAIKLLRPQTSSRHGRDRMLQEARALARVTHPNVVGIHEVGRIRSDEGEVEPVYIVLELVEGQTLGQWHSGAVRPWKPTLELLMGAARGLAAVHDAGLIHRDFKPDNVLIEASTGHAKVADFGLVFVDDSAVSTQNQSWNDEITAQAQQEQLQLHTLPIVHTRVGAIMGTPAYMAPEQVMGRLVTPACDQFAFCLCLWEALHGAHPWIVSTLNELRMAAATGKKVPKQSLQSLPRWLVQALKRGLASDPSQRFPDMHALIRALEKGPRRVRQRTMAGVFAASVAVTAGLSAWLVKAPDEGPQTPDKAACHASLDHLTSTWATPQRDALERAFVVAEGEGARKGAHYLVNFIEGRTKTFRTELIRLCELADARPLSPREQLIHACLDQRSARLEAIVEVLSEPGPMTIEGAFDVTQSSLDLGQCAQSQSLSLLPREPLRRQRYIELTADLARLQAKLIKVDGLDEADFDQLQGPIEDFGHGSLTGEFWGAKGRHWMWLRELDKQEAAFRMGFIASSTAGDDLLALDNLGGLLHSLGSQGRGAEAAWILDMGNILQARHGQGNPHEVAQWLIFRGNYFYIQHDFDRAAEDADQARKLVEATPQSEAAALDCAGLSASSLRASGKYDEAARLYDEIIELENEVFGPRPGRSFHTYWGFSLLYTGRDMTRSVTLANKALEYTDGTTALNEAGVYRELVGMHAGAGDYERALLAADQGRIFFDAHPMLRSRQPVLEEYAAEALIELGRLGEAEILLARITAKTYGEDIPVRDQGRSRVSLIRARIHLERNELERAQTELELFSSKRAPSPCATSATRVGSNYSARSSTTPAVISTSHRRTCALAWLFSPIN